MMHQEPKDRFPEIRVPDTRNFALQLALCEIKTLWYSIYTAFSWRRNDYMKRRAMKTSFPTILLLWEVLFPLQIPHLQNEDNSNYCPALCGHISYKAFFFNIPNIQTYIAVYNKNKAFKT